MGEVRREYLGGIGAVILVSFLAWLVASQILLGKPVFEAEPETDAKALETGAYLLDVDTDPATPEPGDNRLSIQAEDKQGRAVAGASVRVILKTIAEQGESEGGVLEFPVDEDSPGTYIAQVRIPASGTWPLLVEIDSEELGHVDLAFDMTTGTPGLALKSAPPVGKTHYTCPMHPTVKSLDVVGQCPLCGMDLTPVRAEPEGISHYTCAMHPSIENAEAGQCPICGMDLTPVSFEDKRSGSVIVDNRRRQLIGLKTADAFRGDLEDRIRLVGSVQYDPAVTTEIALPLDGRIGQVFVFYEGTPVKAGDSLFTVSSPDLYEAEIELLQIVEETANLDCREASLARSLLLSLGLDRWDLRQLVEAGNPAPYRTVSAPIDGILVETNVLTGSVFSVGDTLMRIVDPSSIWIKASAYESDVKYIQPDMPTTVKVPYATPGEIAGSVSFIRPVLNHHDHTADVFVRAPYEGPAVLANSYADVYLDVTLKDQLLIPEQAVIFAGENRVVFVDEGEGKLQPRKIKTGRRTREYVQVLEGLSAGETVVVSGNFLLASESKLKAGIDQW